ncbi:MAG: universal stress protein [Solirubrobacterales bacterium]
MSSRWEKVVVGFDAAEQSRDALRLGATLAAAEGAELQVAVVLPRGRAPFEKAIAGGQLAEQLDEQLFGSAARELEEAQFTPVKLDGGLAGRSAARALYEHAGEQGVDLIVVGSSHRGKLGRVLPGSVGESLLRGAPCAVAVAPRGYARAEHPAIRLIGVAYDGSEEAKLALGEAERLARALGARIHLITVVPVRTAIVLEADLAFELGKALHREYQQRLDEAVSALGSKTSAEGEPAEGDPASVLVERGSQLDLLVMGSRGYGPVRAALLGGVSAQVIRTAPCPVLVTRRVSAESSDRMNRPTAR